MTLRELILSRLEIGRILNKDDFLKYLDEVAEGLPLGESIEKTFTHRGELVLKLVVIHQRHTTYINRHYFKFVLYHEGDTISTFDGYRFYKTTAVNNTWAALSQKGIVSFVYSDPDLLFADLSCMVAFVLGLDGWQISYLKKFEYAQISTCVHPTLYSVLKGKTELEQRKLIKDNFTPGSYPLNEELCPYLGVLILRGSGVGVYNHKGSAEIANPLVIKPNWGRFFPEIRNIADDGITRYSDIGYCAGDFVELDGSRVRSGYFNYFALRNQVYTCKSCSKPTLHRLYQGKCSKCLPFDPKRMEVLGYSTDVLTIIPRSIINSPVKSPLAFQNFQKIPLLYGCELEYNVKSGHSEDSRYHWLVHLPNHVIFKGDSSLKVGGFEMVTIPARLGEHLTLFRAPFDNFPDEIARDDPSAGMHIHATKAAVTMLTLSRVIDFMHNADNAQFLEMVAERPLGGYCSQDNSRSFGFLLWNPDGRSGRHVSLNTNKKNTFEFRIFRSPYNYLSFAKNLQFCDRLIHLMQAGWTQFTPKESRHYGAFLKWVKDQNTSKKEERSTCHHLFEYLKEKGAYS